MPGMSRHMAELHWKGELHLQQNDLIPKHCNLRLQACHLCLSPLLQFLLRQKVVMVHAKPQCLSSGPTGNAKHQSCLCKSRDRTLQCRTQALPHVSRAMEHKLVLKHASLLQGACADIRTSPCMCDTPPAWCALWQAGLCSLQLPQQPLPCPPWWRTPDQRTAPPLCRHPIIISNPGTYTTALPVTDILGEISARYLLIHCNISQHADRHRHCDTAEQRTKALP